MSQATADSGIPQLADDDRLQKLAAAPALPVFPLLRHAEAMVPLVVVFAFLPSLYALRYRTLTETGAEHGLHALQCLAAKDPGEFVDPGGADPSGIHEWSFPLMDWVTACFLDWFGTEQVAGFRAPGYLCTAGLILSAYLLARRFGGEKLGLLTSLLLAVNPNILQLAQEPLPESLAVMLALLALTGVVAHWQKSGAMLSYQLLLAGIALGLCVLAGGPLTLALLAVLIVHAAGWKIDYLYRKRHDTVPTRYQLSRRTALRSLMVFAVTGFAVGGWWPMLMGSRYGISFWQAWLGGKNTGGAGVFRSSAAWIPELNSLVLPVAGLALLGVLGIFRSLIQNAEDPAKQHRPLILVWTVVALIVWGANFYTAGSSLSEIWKIWLIVPLVMLAALGVLDILERQASFSVSLVFGILTLVDLFVMLFPHFAPASVLGSEGNPSDSGSIVVGITVLIVAAGGAMYAFARQSDWRQRCVLGGTLVVVLLGSGLWAASAVRRETPDDLELQEFRTALARVPEVAAWALLPANPAAELSHTPPVHLEFTLARQWRLAQRRPWTNWDEVAQQAGTTPEGTQVVVAWASRGRARPAVPVTSFRSIGPPYYYHGFEVAIYAAGETAVP